MFTAMCRKFGVVPVDTLDVLIEMSLAFSAGRLPHGDRVAFVGYSGGAKGLFLDIAETDAVSMPDFTPETQAVLREHIDAGVQPAIRWTLALAWPGGFPNLPKSQKS